METTFKKKHPKKFSNRGHAPGAPPLDLPLQKKKNKKTQQKGYRKAARLPQGIKKGYRKTAKRLPQGSKATARYQKRLPQDSKKVTSRQQDYRKAAKKATARQQKNYRKNVNISFPSNLTCQYSSKESKVVHFKTMINVASFVFKFDGC